MYHIYNRGVNKQSIFNDASDFHNFLERIKAIQGRKHSLTSSKIIPMSNSFRVVAYCLTNNEMHLLVQQKSKVPVSSFMAKLCTGYSKYFNKKYNRSGQLFQDTYVAKPILTDSQLLLTTASIHAVPNKPYSHKYSSLREYLYAEGENKLCEVDIPAVLVGSYHSFFGQYCLNKKDSLRI